MTVMTAIPILVNEHPVNFKVNDPASCSVIINDKIRKLIVEGNVVQIKK